MTTCSTGICSNLVRFVTSQCDFISYFLCVLGGSRGSHCEENTGRSGAGGTRFGAHGAAPADAAPAVPQQPRQRRPPHDGRMDVSSGNTAGPPTTLEDVITGSKFPLVSYLEMESPYII